MYIKRKIENDVLSALANFPVVAVTGPRQCGKSTMVKRLFEGLNGVLYLDLERQSDLLKLENAEWFLSSQRDKLICIDEVQRHPELFALIRSLVDEWDRPGCFLILGSASRDLLKQSSESLAGRIVYKRLTPFLWSEIGGSLPMEQYISGGAFPRSLLAKGEGVSFEWRESFISTFIERDLRQWAGFASSTMTRLWRMLAHLNGDTANHSRLASALGVSSVSVKRYIDLLASAYMVEAVSPYFSNLGKRLVKAHKIYIADSGISSALLGLRSFEEILGHPAIGGIWEQVVLSNIIGHCPNACVFYYRTANGAEIDFVVESRGKIFAVECKASHTPSLSSGNYNAINDIAPERTFVVVPSDKSWPMNERIDVVSLSDLVDALARA